MPDGSSDETAAQGARSWEVAAVLAGGYAQKIGRFQYFVADHRWVWSDEVARMHGYEPGQVEPTTELLLSHKHPDDRAEVAEILERVTDGGLFSSRHRIIDTAGNVHWMVVVSDHLFDDSGHAVGTQGYYIDVSVGLQADLTKAMNTVVKSREIIDQAKGVLMVAYGISADQAFGILTWRSQASQRKLKDVAADFVNRLMRAGLSAESVGTIDHLLLMDGSADD